MKNVPVRVRPGRIIVLLLIVAVSVAGLRQLEPFATGANLFCIGHSFFVPICRTFHDYVVNGNSQQYQDHGFHEFFRGGINGSPKKLWENNRQDIQEHLSLGTTQILGLTIHVDTGVDDYINWIDLALSYNLHSAFLIGVPWDADGPLKTTEVFNENVENFKLQMLQLVKQLRARYPNNAIYLLHYGFIASGMRLLWDDNQLEDVPNLCCDATDSLFRDERPGHQGEMMRDVAALFWLRYLYGDTTYSIGDRYNEENVQDILAFAQTSNEGLNDQVLTICAPSTTPFPAPPPTSLDASPNIFQFLLQTLRWFLSFL